MNTVATLPIALTSLSTGQTARFHEARLDTHSVGLLRALGLSETQVVHVALANLARQTLPRYEADNGPLTKEQMDAIRRLQPPGRMKVKASLF